MVGAAGLERFLKKHRTIGLDSSILIYFIEADPVYGPLARNIFEWMEAGRIRGIWVDAHSLGGVGSAISEKR